MPKGINFIGAKILNKMFRLGRTDSVDPDHEPPNLDLCCLQIQLHVQSTLVISKSKGPSKTLRDIRTSTYQICRVEEKTIRTK